jgi:hypothetical protein
MVDYVSGAVWMCTWPVLIYISYKFIVLNINHFEEYLKDR